MKCRYLNNEHFSRKHNFRNKMFAIAVSTLSMQHPHDHTPCILD